MQSGYQAIPNQIDDSKANGQGFNEHKKTGNHFSLFTATQNKKESKEQYIEYHETADPLAMTKVRLLPQKSNLKAYHLNELEKTIDKLFDYLNSLESKDNQIYQSDFVEKLILKINAVNGPLSQFLSNCVILLNILLITNSDLEYNFDIKGKGALPFVKNLPGYDTIDLKERMLTIDGKIKKLQESVNEKKKYIDTFKFFNHPVMFKKIHASIINGCESIQKEFFVSRGDLGSYEPPVQSI